LFPLVTRIRIIIIIIIIIIITDNKTNQALARNFKVLGKPGGVP